MTFRMPVPKDRVLFLLVGCLICLMAGADIPGMPLETLMVIGGDEGATSPSLDLVCACQDFVICKHDQPALPFCLGQVLDIEDGQCIVQWYYPSESAESSMKAGRNLFVISQRLSCERPHPKQ